MNFRIRTFLAVLLCAALLAPSETNALMLITLSSSSTREITGDLFTSQTLSNVSQEFNAVLSRSVFLQGRKRDAQAVRRSCDAHPRLWQSGLAVIPVTLLLITHPWITLISLSFSFFRLSISFTNSVGRTVALVKNSGKPGWPSVQELFTGATLRSRLDYEALTWMIDHGPQKIETIADIRSILESIGIVGSDLGAAIDTLNYNAAMLKIPGEAKTAPIPPSKQLLPPPLPGSPRPGSAAKTTTSSAAPVDKENEPVLSAREIERRTRASIISTYGPINEQRIFDFFTQVTGADLLWAHLPMLSGERLNLAIHVLETGQRDWKTGLDAIEWIEDSYDLSIRAMQHILRMTEHRIPLSVLLRDPNLRLRAHDAVDGRGTQVSLKNLYTQEIYALEWSYSPESQMIEIQNLTYPIGSQPQDFLDALLLTALSMHHRQNPEHPATHIRIHTALNRTEKNWAEHLTNIAAIQEFELHGKNSYQGDLDWSWISSASTLPPPTTDQTADISQWEFFSATQAIPHLDRQSISIPGAPAPLIWIELSRPSSRTRPHHGVFALIPMKQNSRVTDNERPHYLVIETRSQTLSNWPSEVSTLIIQVRHSSFFNLTPIGTRVSPANRTLNGYVGAWDVELHRNTGMPLLEAVTTVAEQRGLKIPGLLNAMIQLELLTEREARTVRHQSQLQESLSEESSTPLSVVVEEEPVSQTAPVIQDVFPVVTHREVIAPASIPKAPRTLLITPAPSRSDRTMGAKERARRERRFAPPTPSGAVVTPPVVTQPTAPVRPVAPAPTRVERWITHVLSDYITSAHALYQFLKLPLLEGSADLPNALTVLRHPQLVKKLTELGLHFKMGEPQILETALDAFRRAGIIKSKTLTPASIDSVPETLPHATNTPASSSRATEGPLESKPEGIFNYVRFRIQAFFRDLTSPFRRTSQNLRSQS
jgi:hypothetical protein